MEDLGDECISKRLDRFLVVESLISTVQKFRTWVEYPFLSDHAPILMEFGSCFAQ
jgi:endonuclease/exonuclease/phosphatase family metal-dependent hydrolase